MWSPSFLLTELTCPDVPSPEERTMFVVDCPGHGAPTVLSVSSITAIDQQGGIIDVRLRCWCGATVVHRTGRNAHPSGHRRQDGDTIAC